MITFPKFEQSLQNQYLKNIVLRKAFFAIYCFMVLIIFRAADGIAGLWHLDSDEIKIIELNHAQDVNMKFMQNSDVTSIIWNVSLIIALFYNYQ